MNEEKKIKLSPPWIEAYNDLAALFGGDPDVKVDYDDGETKTITLRVKGNDKAAAIAKLLPESYKFGNITVAVKVLPSNEEETPEDILRRAFTGNPAFVEVLKSGGFGFEFTYAVFKREVVEYFNDDMRDPEGMKYTLFADIARERLNAPVRVHFTTASM